MITAELEQTEMARTVQQLGDLIGSYTHATQHLNIAGTPMSLIPPGYELKLHPELRDSPVRTKRRYVAHTAESFLDYVNRYSDEHTTVFVDLECFRAVAVLDYDAPSEGDVNGARFGEHVAVYAFPRAKEATDWLAHNGKRMTQADFALFLEQHLPDIVDPVGAEMLEVALTLQAKTTVDFRKGIRLDNGQVQLTYKEEIDGSAGTTGQVKIPSEFILGLQLFKGSDLYQVDAKLRYRIKEGVLLMWYDLLRPEAVLDDAVKGIADMIRDSLDRGHLVFGALGDRA